MGYWDDFKLGVKGVGDLVAHSMGAETAWAAEEYARQVGQDVSLSESQV